MHLSHPNTIVHQLASFNAFDWLLIIVLAWSIVTAFARGFIREAFGLAGTVVGLLLASWNYRQFARWLARWITSPSAADIVAFLLIAAGVMLLCALLGRLLRGTAHTIGLGFLDRLLGALFGGVRGALVATMIMMAVTAFLPPQPLVANSQLGPYFLAAAREVCFVVPQYLQQRITGGIVSIGHLARR